MISFTLTVLYIVLSIRMIKEEREEKRQKKEAEKAAKEETSSETESSSPKTETIRKRAKKADCE